MELRVLRYLLEVAREENFTKARTARPYSPTAISG